MAFFPNPKEGSMRAWLKKERKEVMLVAVLLLLNLVPIAAGIWRVWGLQVQTAENARFFDAPIATWIHIVGSCVFGLVGIGQFVNSFRRRHPAWHRRAGWLLAVSGLASALSGLWMTLVFRHGPGDSTLLDAFRLVFGLGMTAAMVLGIVCARRRDLLRHRAWMVRGYAIGMGAGTQVVLFVPWILMFAPPDAIGRALILGAGWTLNLLLAEWWVSRNGPRRPPRPIQA